MSEQDTSTREKLVKAYERMMERVRSTLDEAEENAVPTLRRNIDHARDTAVELGELTRDEAEKIAMYLQRDIEDAGQYLAESGRELGDWLRIDLELIEDRLLEMIGQVADKTRLEWLQLEQELKDAPNYHTGEITGPGVLICTACEHPLHFESTAHIPPCAQCHGTHFRRPVEGE